MASKQESDMENEQNYTVEYVGNQYVYNTNYCLSKCTTTQKCKVNTEQQYHRRESLFLSPFK